MHWCDDSSFQTVRASGQFRESMCERQTQICMMRLPVIPPNPESTCHYETETGRHDL